MKTIAHDIADMREHFAYDPVTGVITNTRRRRGLKPHLVGKATGTLAANGHFYISFRGKKWLASRFAWAMHHGVWPVHEIDHRDGDTQNNALLNLRDITSSAQKRNRKPYGKTGVKSVHIHQGCYRASLTVNRKAVPLGSFTDLKDAETAVIAAEKEHHVHQYRRFS